MLVKRIVDEDLSNYCRPDMLIGFPRCTFKCDKECGKKVCQNSELAYAPNIDVTIDETVRRYLDNKLTSAIVFGGLEPIDSWYDMTSLIQTFREVTDDDIVIYTGYTEDELFEALKVLRGYKNIVVKFGRFVPGQQKHLDPVLNVELASGNQYAKKIS